VRELPRCELGLEVVDERLELLLGLAGDDPLAVARDVAEHVVVDERDELELLDHAQTGARGDGERLLDVLERVRRGWRARSTGGGRRSPGVRRAISASPSRQLSVTSSSGISSSPMIASLISAMSSCLVRT
jgi:hypothetical protein